MRGGPYGQRLRRSRWFSGMTYDTLPDQRLRSPYAGPPVGLMLSPADYDEVTRELESLRRAHRTELAERLRDAREFGSPGDDDDRLAVLEDTAIDRLKIAQLERLVASATVIEETVGDHGIAALGSLVRVQDEAGRETDYELVGRRSADGARTQITPASPVGEALLG